jgi:hypothetical protein
MAAVTFTLLLPRLVARGRVLAHAPRLALVALVAMLLGTAAPVRAQEASEAPERAVKAAFLYKFLGYVEWPPTALPHADTPFVIGIMGADEIAAELVQITTGRTVDNRSLVVRRLRDGDPLAGLHAIFVGRSEAARMAPLLRAAQQHGILTVTESPGALDLGSAINFLLLEGRVRFEISVDAAEKSGLKLSSRLLSVAQAVRTGS